MKWFLEGVDFICGIVGMWLLFIGAYIKYSKNQADAYKIISPAFENTQIHVVCDISKKTEDGRFNHRPINKFDILNELEIVANMALDAYGDNVMAWTEWREKLYEWCLHRPEMFTFLIDNNKIIGLLCVMPINIKRGKTGKKHYDGLIEQKFITKDMISKGPSNTIFVPIFYIDPSYIQESLALNHLINCFYKKIADFTYAGTSYNNDTVIYAEANSLNNKRFLKTLGFTAFGKKSANHKQLMELRFFYTNNNDKAHTTIRNVNFTKNNGL